MSSYLPPAQITGISIPCNPLIISAVELAHATLSPQAFNHVMRSFLFGVIIASRSLTSSDAFDADVQAISAILHDLGWALESRFISNDKRFEVDGAIAARDFLTDSKYSDKWPPQRTQLVWDSIALHATPSFYKYKETEVRICGLGVSADFRGPESVPDGALSWDEYHAVVKEYPREGLVQSVKDVFVGLCQMKPKTTYDNEVGDVGEVYVKGYTRDGHR